MFDVWSAVRWWDEWQLRILVLASLCVQWFLLLAAPMRKYTIPHWFRTFIWLAYVSSDALAIYALATLFNRHARANTGGVGCGTPGDTAASRASILEVLWAPVLLIHLGGQEELTAYNIEDNELWIRHTVTLVSQVTVALYSFYKSWPSSSDWKLLASAILLFVIGVLSFSEKPWALRKASINRLAKVSAVIQGTQRRTKWDSYLNEFFFFDEYNCFAKSGGDQEAKGNSKKKGKEESKIAAPSIQGTTAAENERSSTTRWRELFEKYNCFTTKAAPGRGKEEEGRNSKQQRGVAPKTLSDGDKVYMILSDMSLSAAADDLVKRDKAKRVTVDDVLQPLSPSAEKGLKRWLRGAYVLIYTRANVVFTPMYLAYHLLLVPALHIAALTLFATSDKRGYNYTDVKTTYVLLSFTAALDVLAVFIRQLLYLVMSVADVPALCETVPGYNLVDAVLRRRQKTCGWLVKCATKLGCKEEYFVWNGDDPYRLYKKVSGLVLSDLVNARGRDLASYRIFTAPEPKPAPRGPNLNDQKPRQHAAAARDTEITAEAEHSRPPPQAAGESSSNWVLSLELQAECGPRIRDTLRGSFDRSVLLLHIATDICFRMQDHRRPADSTTSCLSRWWCSSGGCAPSETDEDELRDKNLLLLRKECTQAISNYMAHLLNFRPEMLMTGSRRHLVAEAMKEIEPILNKARDSSKRLRKPNQDDLQKMINMVEVPNYFQIPEACKLAAELLALGEEKRWEVMYHVWVGMLCYSASMCRGYLHAKSLGEGGEFLSFVWLVLSLKGAKTLADKLQMVEAPVPDPKKTSSSSTATAAAAGSSDSRFKQKLGNLKRRGD